MSTTAEPRRFALPRAGDLNRHAPLLALAVVALAFGLSAWPIPTLIPIPGLDPSWEVGLYLIFHDGYNYGSDVIFTFGPLGFLHYPAAVYRWPLRLAFLYLLVIQFALAATLLWNMRQAFRTWWLAIPFAFILTTIIAGEASTVIGFTAAIALIAGRPQTQRQATLVAVGLGVLAGIESLSKINVGVLLVLLVIIAAATSPQWRRTAITLAAATLGTALLAWIVTGQSLTAIPSYISGSIAISSGYASGMVYVWPNSVWQLYAAFLIGGLGVIVAFRAGLGLALRQRIGLLAAWALVWFLAFKTGFVRQDPGHPVIFLQDTLGALTAFGWAVRRRETALLVGLAPLMLYLALTATDPAKVFWPHTRLAAVKHQLGVLSSGTKTNDEINAARASIIAGTPVDQETLDAVKGKTVTIEPYGISVAFAYKLPWKPLPIIQGYAAYTHALDTRQAKALADPDGPKTIMRQIGNYAAAVDLRQQIWDPPAAMRAMLCHFKQASPSTGVWQVLERVPNRCGTPHEIKTVKAGLGVPVTVPAAPPGEALYVDVDGYGLGPAEKLRKLFYRAVTRTITLNGQLAYPMPAETAGDGLLLRVPETADYTPAPFSMNVNPQTIQFNRGSGEQSDDEVTLHFMAVPIS